MTKNTLAAFICLTTLSTFTALYATSIKKLGDAPMLNLGDGYSTFDQISTGHPALDMSKTGVIYGDLQNTIHLTDTINRAELATDLGIYASASGGWGPFSSGASANYFAATDNTEYAENFSYSELFYANAKLNFNQLPPNLGAFNTDAANLYTQSGITAFTNTYGDTFIQQLSMGAFFVTTISFNFNTASDKENFDTSIGGNFGSIFSATATIQGAVSSSHSKGTIEVSAYQLGGDPSQLAGIFAQPSGGGYYVTSCSLDNLQACMNTINGVINYAQNNFSQQIKPSVSAGEPPQGNLAAVGQPTLGYYSSDFNIAPAPAIDPSVLVSRLNLAKVYNTLATNKTFFDHFMASPAMSYLTPAANVLVTQIDEALNWNWSLLQDLNPMSCYTLGQESSCPNLVSTYNQNAEVVDQSIVDYYMNTGYSELDMPCNFFPVDVPQAADNPLFGGFCQAAGWVNGRYNYKLSPDKSTLSTTADFFWTDGDHYQSSSTLTTKDNVTYSGTMTTHDLSTGKVFQGPVLFTITKNNI